jgi:hypothetical protein
MSPFIRLCSVVAIELSSIAMASVAVFEASMSRPVAVRADVVVSRRDDHPRRGGSMRDGGSRTPKIQLAWVQ